jgi:four helix bundle protein
VQFKRVEDLTLWERANQFWEEVATVLERAAIRRHEKLHEQISEAVDSVLSNISEGFEQPTDRAFANYLYTVKASAAEVRTRLKLCWQRGFITREEFESRSALADEIGRMATGLIRYLLKSNRRDRGIGPTASRPRRSAPRRVD